MPKLFIVATTFWPIFPLFPTPTTTSFPPEPIDVVIALTALESPSWAVSLDSYRPSSCVRASRSVLITCSAVANASLLQISSIGPPASDIAADESGDVGVSGSWYMAGETILDSPMMNRDSGRFFYVEYPDWEFTSTRAFLRLQNIIVIRFLGKQRTLGGLPLRIKARLKEVEQEVQSGGEGSSRRRSCAHGVPKIEKKKQDQAILYNVTARSVSKKLFHEVVVA